MNKKLLLVICCIFLSFIILSGCSPTDNNENNTTYKIEVNAEIEHGEIIPSKSEATKGETITIDILPDEGYRLKEGSLSGSNTHVEDNSFTMPENDVMLFAEFEQVCNITIDDAITGGTITVDYTKVAKGETITATAIPESGYRLKDDLILFGNFKKAINANSQASFDIHSDTIISAVFELIPDLLKITSFQITATQPGSNTTHFSLDDIIISIDFLREKPIISYSSGQTEEGNGHIFYDKDEEILNLTFDGSAFLIESDNIFEDGQEIDLHFQAQFYETLSNGPSANGATSSKFPIVPSVCDEIIVEIANKIFAPNASSYIVIKATIIFAKI